MADVTLPSGLIKAEELAEKLKKHKCPITAEDLDRLAHAGVIPCFWWNFEDRIHGPYFHVGPVKEWLVSAGYFKRQVGDPPKTKKPLYKRVEEVEEAIRALLKK